MRLPSAAPLCAALEAGANLLDTARAYPGNEALVAEVLRAWPGPRPRLVTKGGMGEGWRPDGRAKKIVEDCEASLAALGQIDLWLLHAPDPRVDLKLSVRAMAKLPVGGLGLSNVTLAQLKVALELAPISAVQVPLGAFHLGPFRDGIVGFCLKHGIQVQAWGPLGGMKRAAGLVRNRVFARVGARHGISAQRAVLSWLYDLGVVPLPGAQRVETARDIVPVTLTEQDRAELDAEFTAAARAVRPRPPAARVDGEVVLVMGIAGAGKTRAVAGWVARGFERLNRDERGGTLKSLAHELDARLAAGARQVVLDNTYLTRASRDAVIEVAQKHGLEVRCVWLDTPLEQAQVNVVERGRDDGMLPTSLLRMARELEPPSAEEGFAEIERVPFVRAPLRERPGLIVSLDAVGAVREWSSPALVIAWRPKSVPVLPEGVELAICEHEGGPPRCWCRPPLPGLAVQWAKRQGVELTRSRFVGVSAADRKLAAALGCDFVEAAVQKAVAPGPLIGE
ncbi:MAG: aldo/keto reductase [Archangiaceae bacterium]|nr:aldo/keto reductase [Archangiaceae bacterium]